MTLPESDISIPNRNQAPKVAGMMALALVAIACVGSLSQRMGSVQLEQTKLDGESFDVADAILQNAGVHDKKGSIPASIAALAAQAAQEKQTGRLATTVELPQIPAKIAKEAAEAKKEIMIERHIATKTKDAKEKAAKAKLAAKKAAEAKKAQLAKVQKADSKTQVAKDVAMVKKVAAKAKLAAKSAKVAKK